MSLLLAALAAGATAGVSDSAKDAVTGLYGMLKAAILGKATDDPGAGKTLDRYAADPEGYRTPVRDLITESAADQDEALLTMAKELLSKADPAGAQVGKYNIHITGGQGHVTGDRVTVTQTFNSPPTST